MKRLTVCAISFVAAITAFAPLARAQQMANIAVIDVQRVVTESDPGKEALGKLKQLQEQKIEQGKKLQQQLESMTNDYSKQRFTLSDSKLEELQKNIEDKKIELKRFQDDAQREIEDARRKALGALEQRIMPIIQKLGKEKGYLMIFQKYQSGLVYADDARTDITDEVIRRFNTSQQ